MARTHGARAATAGLERQIHTPNHDRVRVIAQSKRAWRLRVKNLTRDERVLELVAPHAVAGGGGMKIGAIFGVAVVGASQGVTVEVATAGIHDLPKVTAQAWAVGEAVFWDDHRSCARRRRPATRALAWPRPRSADGPRRVASGWMKRPMCPGGNGPGQAANPCSP
jgi:predicted RecA/RadA family phage recombinase